MLTASVVKQQLGLQPHPREGGWYTRTVESAEMLVFPQGRYTSERRLHTAIYYLLEAHTFSEMHRLRSDEVFHHYLGSPVEMLQLHAGGSASTYHLGPDLMAGQRPQLLVAAGTWQGCHLLDRSDVGAFALLGCTVTPGFEFEDYESAGFAELVRGWPQAVERLRILTTH